MLGPSWLQVGSGWPMLAPSWLPLKTIHAVACPTSRNPWPQVGSMLAPCCLMLAPCCLRLAHFGLMLGHVGLKTAPGRSMLAPGEPRDAKNCLPGPPRCLKNASGRPQDDLKIGIFEVFVRKTRKCISTYVFHCFLHFGRVLFSSIFE